MIFAPRQRWSFDLLSDEGEAVIRRMVDDIKAESEKLQDYANTNLKTATTAIKGQFKSFRDYVASSEVAEKTQEYAAMAKDATMDAASKAKDMAGNAAKKARDSDTVDSLKDTAAKAKDATVDAAYKAKDMAENAAKKVLDSDTVDSLKGAAGKIGAAAGLAGASAAIHHASDKIQEKLGWKKPTLAQRIFGNKLFGRWESVKDEAEVQALNFQHSVRQKTKELKDKLTNVMSDEAVSHDEEIQSRAGALRESINSLEARASSKAKQLINLFSLGHLFKETPMSGHQMHRPFLSCAGCGRLYSLSEFLNTYDPQHQLNLIEENFWSDAEVEEFWQGWAEYANHMKLHCTECGGNEWSGVAFAVSDNLSESKNSTMGIDTSKTYVEKDLASETGAKRHIEL